MNNYLFKPLSFHTVSESLLRMGCWYLWRKSNCLHSLSCPSGKDWETLGFPEVLLQQQGHVGLLADTPPSEGAFLDEACQPFWEAAILSH